MYTETPDIIPFTSPIKGEVLAQKELENLKGKTLHILNEIGVHFPSPKALDIFASHGARVDFEKQIVRIPPDLVTKAMSTAPRSFILGGRKERFDLLLDGNCSYLSTDGTGVHVIDLETRAKRPSCKDDVALMARVCDALPLVSFFWPMVSSKEYGHTAPLHNCHASLINTLKHVRGGTTVPPRLAPYILEMATVVAGSTEERIKRPPICANICTISPLSHDQHGIETSLLYAEAGIPTSFMAMPTMGSTAPATPLGALVMGDAEVMVQKALSWAIREWTRVDAERTAALLRAETAIAVGIVTYSNKVMDTVGGSLMKISPLAALVVVAGGGVWCHAVLSRHDADVVV